MKIVRYFTRCKTSFSELSGFREIEMFRFHTRNVKKKKIQVLTTSVSISRF